MACCGQGNPPQAAGTIAAPGSVNGLVARFQSVDRYDPLHCVSIDVDGDCILYLTAAEATAAVPGSVARTVLVNLS